MLRSKHHSRIRKQRVRKRRWSTARGSNQATTTPQVGTVRKHSKQLLGLDILVGAGVEVAAVDLFTRSGTKALQKLRSFVGFFKRNLRFYGSQVTVTFVKKCQVLFGEISVTCTYLRIYSHILSWKSFHQNSSVALLKSYAIKCHELCVRACVRVGEWVSECITNERVGAWLTDWLTNWLTD